MRLTPLLAGLCLGCGSDKSEPPPGTGTPPTAEDSGTTSTGEPTGSGTGTGTGTGTATGTTQTSRDFCPPWPVATGTTVVVTPTDILPLQDQLDLLNPGDTALMATGTWTLTTALTLTVPGITIRSQSGNRADVVLDGDQTAISIFDVQASDVSLVSLTLTNAYQNGVNAVPPTAGITGLTLYDVDVVDNSQYGVFIDAGAGSFHADQGTIACSHIGLSAAGRATVRNGCRTAGIEALRAMDWSIRDTTVDGYWCAAGESPAGIRFWRGSRGTTIERSRVLHNRRGIVLGQGDDAIGRIHADQPCGALIAQHYDATVNNTLVWTDDAGLEASAGGIVDGIALESSCNVEVLHNTVHLGDSPSEGSIIHRYADTSGIVANNLTHNTIRRMDGATTVSNFNIENAGDFNWVHVPSGDFHLAPGATEPVDAGDAQWLTNVPEDADGHPRTPAPDAGLDERP